MTEIKMKRIGLRLVVISVVSLVVFLSIRKQYNTAQSMLQQKAALSPISLKGGTDGGDGAEGRTAEGDSLAIVRFGGPGAGEIKGGINGWTKNRLDESIAKFEIELVNGKTSKNNGEVQEEEEVVFYDTDQDYSKDRETLIVSMVDHLQPKEKLSYSEDVSPTEDVVLETQEYRDENVFRTQTETLPEDSHLEMIQEVENVNENDENTVEENGDDGMEGTPNVIEVYITPLPDNDVAETDGGVENVEDEVEDIINEYDEYTDEPKQRTDVFRQVTEDVSPIDVTLNPLQDIIESLEHQEPADSSVTPKATDSLLVSGQHLEGQANDYTNALQVSLVAQRDKQQPESPMGPTPLLQTDSRHLQETLTQGLLTSILGNKLSPRIVRYLRYKLLTSLQKSQSKDIAISPAESQSSLSSSTPKVDIKKTDNMQDHITVSYEIRNVELNGVGESDVNAAEDNNTFRNLPAASVYADQKQTPNYTTHTPNVNGYDNPRPLSDADYSLLRTRTNIQPHSSSQTASPSDTTKDVTTRSSLENFTPHSHGGYQTNSNRIVFSSEFLTTPTWMKPGLPSEHQFTNEKSFPEAKTVYPLSEVLRQPQQSERFQNTTNESVNNIDSEYHQTNMSGEQVEENQMDRDDLRSLQGPAGDHVLYRQLKSQAEALQLIQEHNDPGEPGHSYQDLLLQQRVQFNQPVVGMSSKDILTPLDNKEPRKYPSRVEACPREVKLGERPHAVTALVSFPGDDTTWIRQILEQLLGETTDSLYDITADLQAGNAGRVYEMSKHVAIQTHSVLDRNFERAVVLIRNPYSVEERHRMFRPDYIDWQKQHLWGDTYSSWLSSDLPLYIIVYEDMVESPLTELIKLADFLRNDDFKVNYQCAMGVAERPPKMVSDLREITGIYFKERRNINENIDKVLQAAKTKFPELITRLESYKV